MGGGEKGGLLVREGEELLAAEGICRVFFFQAILKMKERSIFLLLLLIASGLFRTNVLTNPAAPAFIAGQNRS